MSDLEPTEDQYEAYRLRRLEGQLEIAVATQFGVTTKTIYKWCRKVSEWLKTAKREELDTLKADVTAKFEHLYELAVTGYHRSIQPRESTTDSEQFGITTKTEPGVGMPGFLAIAHDSTLAIAKLWGQAIDATDRASFSRVVGKSQLELAREQRKRFQLLESALEKEQAMSGGSGDKA